VGRANREVHQLIAWLVEWRREDVTGWGERLTGAWKEGPGAPEFRDLGTWPDKLDLLLAAFAAEGVPLLGLRIDALGPATPGGQCVRTGPRITADAESRSVTLDGRRFEITRSHVFKLFKALIDAHNAGCTPINRFDLYQKASRKDKDPRPDRLWPSLPAELQAIIKVDAVRGGGYSLGLPSLPPAK
jgi:hypothetical protein